MHEAVKNNHVEVVRLLVEAGADVNAKDEHFVTPLLLAGSAVNRDDPQEMARFVEIIRILVSTKAFINIIHPHTGISQPIVPQLTDETRQAFEFLYYLAILYRDKRNSITRELKKIRGSAKLETKQI